MSIKRSNTVLGVLCAVLAVPTLLQLRSEAETFVDVGRIPLMFDGFTADNVGSIVLGRPKDEQPEPRGQNAPKQPQVAYDQLVLKLTDKGWLIGQPADAATELAGAPARKGKIEADVFHHLRSIRRDPETLVQQGASEEQLAEYGLDEGHAFVVRCVDRAGKTVVADLLVGKDASEWGKGTQGVRGVFVRQRGSDDVVLYEWEKPWRRSVDEREWLDRVLFQLEPDKVRRLSVRNASTGDRTFTFTREANRMSWQAQDADDLGAVRQSEVEGLVQRLRYVSAQSFERPMSRAGNMQAIGLYPPGIEIAIAVEQGGELREIELEVGDKLIDRNEHYLTCSESDFLLTWPASMVAQFELDVAQRMFDPKPK
ncbi:MAG: DUF4340 domain-containing protein [Planctomycetes bacterium]|nr:DUF4340 domain-containing protein [Planctomycetota bacterium]